MSFAASVTRVLAGWWAAQLTWRCIFIFMENGGVSLKGVKWILSPASLTRPSLYDFGRKFNIVILSFVLVATFSLDYLSPILTGSITWRPAFNYAHGNKLLTKISQSAAGISLENYRIYDEEKDRVLYVATSTANVAWGSPELGQDSTLGTIVARRVVNNARYLAVGSTVNSISLPYFAVDAFEWIQDPISTLTTQQKSLNGQVNRWSPWSAVEGQVGLIPDAEWGPPTGSANVAPEPHTVAETRVLSLRLGRLHEDKCQSTYSSYFPPGLQIYLSHSGNNYDCYAFAKVTYRAGSATCSNCRLASSTVFQNDGSLELKPDALTREALALAPSLGTKLLFTGYAVLQTEDMQKFALEIVSRSYQSAWTCLTDLYGDQTGQTEVLVSVLVSKAVIDQWRVYLWVILHILVLLVGMLLVFVQSRCAHPWVDDPTLAAFLLDKGEVVGQEGWEGIDPWHPGQDKLPERLVILEDSDKPTRHLAWKVPYSSGEQYEK